MKVYVLYIVYNLYIQEYIRYSVVFKLYNYILFTIKKLFK